MANKLGEAYKNLPPWSRGIIAIVGVGAVAFVGFKLYKSVFPSLQERQSRQLINEVESEVKGFQNQGMKQSFTDSQYNAFANDIYEGMRYAVGDNYANVERILLSMNNDLDVAKLIKAFGIRQDYAFGIPTGSGKDLITFVNSELGEDYGGLTRYRVDRINTNWKKKGIKYQF